MNIKRLGSPLTLSIFLHDKLMTLLPVKHTPEEEARIDIGKLIAG
jgi:hypothetical protein